MTIDTIAAIATPPGQGGVGIIRLSGPQALAIAKTITQRSSITPRYAHYANFYNEQPSISTFPGLTGASNPVEDSVNNIIDMGLVIYFKGPKSFTGEDIIEFQGHGSPMALERLLARCIECGARMARPGEFCQRAFLNDKIDLTQAEAIADLIAAQSASAARMAVHSLKGQFSDRVNEVLQQLIALRCYVEAAIDFPDEEIDFLSDGKVASDLAEITQLVEQLLVNANQGVILREGINVVLAGKPNAGKSTLLNQLAGRELAIVTDIPGTTRDVMRQHLLIDDIPLHVIDTAGLRDSNDVVEQEGIKRAWSEIKQADCVLLLIDVNNLDERGAMEQQIKQSLPEGIAVIEVINKIDLVAGCQLQPSDIAISAKSGQGLTQLKQRLKQVVGYQGSEGQFLARSRHVEALKHTLNALNQGEVQLREFQAGELLAEELRLAQQHLSEITGEFSADDLLGKIFSSFCIGK